MLQISAKEKRIITEIIRLGIAKAADSFALISKDEVNIEVPELVIIDQKDLLKEIDPNQEVQQVIQSDINGDIAGHTLLFFYDKQVVLLEKLCLNFNYTKAKIKGLRNSLILELSNIITGALVTQLANIFKLNIFGSVPKTPFYPTKSNFEKLSLGLPTNNTLVVTIKTSFIKSGQMVSLPFVIIFDLLNMEKILDIVRTRKNIKL